MTNNRLNIDCDFLDYSIPDLHKDFYLDVDGNSKCEMNRFESAYLCGLIKKYKPQRIIEIGIAAGATTTMILDTLKKYSIDAKLVSVDLNVNYYRNNKKLTGYIALDYYGKDAFTLKTGKYLPEIINQFENKFDFCIIDTVHVLPGEILDYLCIINSMKIHSVMIFHDIHYHIYSKNSIYGKHAYATSLLLNCCVGEKIICYDNTRPFQLPNIGGFIVTEDTFKYLNNVVGLLSMGWHYNISDEEFLIYNYYFRNNLGEDVALYFENTRKANLIYVKEMQEITKERKIKFIMKNKFKEAIKSILPCWAIKLLKKVVG